MDVMGVGARWGGGESLKSLKLDRPASVSTGGDGEDGHRRLLLDAGNRWGVGGEGGGWTDEVSG